MNFSAPFYLSLFISVFLAVTLSLVQNTDTDSEDPAEVREFDEDYLRVMSFNIRYDNPEDGENAWPNRKDFVASTIRLYEADVVGVQEALEHQIKDMIERMPTFSWIGTGRNAERDGEHTAILYNTERLEVLEHDTFWLSETPDVPGSQSWDALLPRIATWALFRDLATDKKFVLLNTHFDHRGPQARVESAKQIMSTVSDIADGLPIVVMGDLNTTEHDEPYAVLSEQSLPDERDLLDGFYHSVHGHHGPLSTWTGFSEIVPDRRIDYIFVSEDVTVNQHAALSDQREGRFPSDHLPVLAEIALPE